jgi:hypothetical protein
MFWREIPRPRSTMCRRRSLGVDSQQQVPADGPRAARSLYLKVERQPSQLRSDNETVIAGC